MKLLVVTQAVDKNNLELGFFHRWLEELAPKFERIDVICLKEGVHNLPATVRVHSLGKEHGAVPRHIYAFRFITLAWSLDREYDTVFVHMNQEYVLIAGWLWKLLGKKIYLWRNHYAGSFLTDIAAFFCDKVFCTSTHSYTARYRKTVIMPVGVDTKRFHPDASVTRVPHSILFFARMAESKRPGLVVDALIDLAKRGVPFTADFVGSPIPKDEQYLAALKQRVADAGLADRITFAPGIPNEKAPDLYRAHAIFVNASPSGMLDKTIFEAAASGCRVLASSDDWKKEADTHSWFEGTVPSLADALQTSLSLSVSEDSAMDAIVATHRLSNLAERLHDELYSEATHDLL